MISSEQRIVLYRWYGILHVKRGPSNVLEKRLRSCGDQTEIFLKNQVDKQDV